MAVIDAWNFPGANGDYARLPNPVDVDPKGLLGHFRTGTGQAAYTVSIIGNVDNIDQTGRGCWWASSRDSNNSLNHQIVFDPGGNNYEYEYNTSVIFDPTLTEVNDTWVNITLSFAGGTGNMTLRRIPLSTATQSHSGTGASGGTSFSDSELQRVTLGGYFDGAAVQQELDGQIALVLIIKGTELSQAALEAYTADPLNYGDTLKSVYGASCFFWDDSGTDSGVNALAAPTLFGGVTRGSGNGPDIPARATPSSDLANLFMTNNLGKVLIR